MRKIYKFKVFVVVLMILCFSVSEYAFAQPPGTVVLLPPTVVLLPAGPGGPGPDTTPPTVWIASPGAGWTLTSIIGIIAAASDNVEMARVDFYIDGGNVSTDSTSPYTYDWDTTKVPDGTHTISVAAYDRDGNVGSAAQFVTVANGAVTAAIAAAPVAGLPISIKKLYQVHVGAYRRLRTARKRTARLRRRGFLSEIITQGGGRPYLVQVALAEDLGVARALAKRLWRKGFRYARIAEVFR